MSPNTPAWLAYQNSFADDMLEQYYDEVMHDGGSCLSHVQAMVDLCLATSARQQRSSLSGFFQTRLQQKPSLCKLLGVNV